MSTPATHCAGFARAGLDWDAPTADHPARLASQRAYAAVARGDLEGWLELYAEDALLEDPVGPSMFDPLGAGHRGHCGLRAFWALAVEPVASFHFHITDSHANGSTCANVARITASYADGSEVDTDMVTIHTVNSDGLLTSMRAFWEPDRAMATQRRGGGA